MKRWPLLVSFVLFIALCVSATYWGMQLYKPPVRAVAAPPPTLQSPPDPRAAVVLASAVGSSFTRSAPRAKSLPR